MSRLKYGYSVVFIGRVYEGLQPTLYLGRGTDIFQLGLRNVRNVMYIILLHHEGSLLKK